MHHDELFKTTEVPHDVLAQAAVFLMTHQQRSTGVEAAASAAAAGTGPWANLPNRRFGDVCERKFDFDHHSIVVRPVSHSSRDPFEVRIGDEYRTTVALTPTSANEVIAQFPHTRTTATIIPLGTKLHVFTSGKHFTLTQPVLEEEEGAAGAATADKLTSPMPATVIEVRVKPGDQVKTGQVCAVLESMKMEISIRAGRDGVVGEVNVDKGQTVEEGMVLVALRSVE